MTRHEVRECAFLILFEMTFREDEPAEEMYALAEEVQDLCVTDGVKAMVEGVLLHKDALDAIIAEYSKKRSLSRLPKLNLTILRLALFEILYDDTMPDNVAISEAITLAGAYTYQEDTAFINGVLGAYVRENRSASEEAAEAVEENA
ncbi:MAG: transcription antitermination factor NusB [Ruminococcus sp.]|nr:transcription antitermination factor NusB [Ruminococcus sp.]